MTPDVSSFLTKNKEHITTPRQAIHSFELVITVLLFVLVGRYLDSHFSVTPLFTLSLSLFAIVGTGVTAYNRYQNISRSLEEEKVWTTEKTRVSIPDIVDEKDELVVPQGYGSDNE